MTSLLLMQAFSGGPAALQPGRLSTHGGGVSVCSRAILEQVHFLNQE